MQSYVALVQHSTLSDCSKSASNTPAVLLLASIAMLFFLSRYQGENRRVFNLADGDIEYKAET